MLQMLVIAHMFAPIINVAMDKNIQQSYELFCRLMNEDHIFLIPSITFPLLCSALGVSASALDRAVFDELGLSGSQLIEHYRATYPRSLQVKYENHKNLVAGIVKTISNL